MNYLLFYHEIEGAIISIGPRVTEFYQEPCLFALEGFKLDGELKKFLQMIHLHPDAMQATANLFDFVQNSQKPNQELWG